MNLVLFGLIQGAVQLLAKFLDGKKTKAGVGFVIAGAGVCAVYLWGVDVAPEQVLGAIILVLACLAIN